MNSHTQSPRKFSIRFTVGSMFILATFLTACTAIGLQYHFTRQMAQEQVLSQLTGASGQISDYLQQIEHSASHSAKILRHLTFDSPALNTPQIRDVFIQILHDQPIFYSVYLGNDQEEFYQIINLESSPDIRPRIQASATDRWVIITITGPAERRQRQTEYLDADLKRTKLTSQTSNYYPTQRPWYRAANEAGVYKTKPYLFKHLKITGQTYSVRNQDKVIGIDIVLSSLSAQLGEHARIMQGGQTIEAFVFDRNGQVLASNQADTATTPDIAPAPLPLTASEQAQLLQTPPLLVSNQIDWPPYDFAEAGKPRGYAIDRLKLIAQMTGLQFEFINGFDSQQLVERFARRELDILHSLRLTDHSQATAIPFYTVPLAIASKQSTPAPKSLDTLHQKPVAIVAGRGIEAWLEPQLIASAIQVHWLLVPDLNSARAKLFAGEVQYIIDGKLALIRLQTNQPSPALSIHSLAFPALPLTIQLAAPQQQLGALFHRANQHISASQQERLTSRWLNSHQSTPNLVPYPALRHLAQDRRNHHQMTLSPNGKHYLYVAPVSSLGVINAGAQAYFAMVIPESVISALVFHRLTTSIVVTLLVMLALLPLAWLFGSPIIHPITALRQQTLRIKRRQFDQVILVNTRIKELHELAQSMVKTARKLKQQQQEREAFVEAIIRLIAQAIDDKSPYTAGHCYRVPILGIQLAEIAERSEQGKARNFQFADENERREFRIAAWLHDCGKITTPEHIVDKGSKLEANYNRIHEIRTRFEVLWRDAEIDYLIAQLDRTMSQPQAFERRLHRQTQLQQDFEFIAHANIGGEYMSDEHIARIKQIATQTWVRHFDNRLGLSPFEELHQQQRAMLPVVEHLLTDKPEHIIPRSRPMRFDPQYGIQMTIPEHLYNQGEIYNLTIPRGTLTDEDRFKINEHMISGIKMLEALPFPAELARVPRYASTHHETLDGKGYPRKLTGAELSIPERILAIADIFEALTAADRPYKKAKPYSVAIQIMHEMAKNQHIDEELFLLFLHEGGFEQYAKEYLPPDQQDFTNINKDHYQP